MKKFNYQDIPLRYKLVIHFLLISILPSILLGVLITWAVDNILEEKVNNSTLQLIDNVNQSLEAHVENAQNVTYLIASNHYVQAFFNGEVNLESMNSDERFEITQFLQQFTTIHPVIAGILIVNKEGNYISNELYPRSSFPLTEESWYLQALNQKGIPIVLGSPKGRKIASHVNYQDDEVISVARAILDPVTQEEKGVILVDVKRRVIAETVKGVRLGKTGFLMVIDDIGEMIFTPTYSKLTDISSSFFEYNYGTFSKVIDGYKIQYIYRKSPFTNWITVGVFPSNDSLSEVKQIRLYIITFVFFVCLFGVTASSFLSRSISKPIYQLMVAMQQAETGNLCSRFQGTTKDEVGRLGRSFNKMLTQINKLLLLTEQQERKKREAELHSLHANIKPHFLYNTLDTIQWLARKDNAIDVANMVESLSKLFRIGLSKGGTIIPLAEEIEHIKSYLQIQSVRYKNKLNYSIHVSPDIQDVQVLKMVLQPIVENAIYHGIKERRGPGSITIEATEIHGLLCLKIEDNGRGMSEEKLTELRKSLALFLKREEEGMVSEPLVGYGVVNVHARLKLTFGEEYGLTIVSQIDKGTIVTVYHPILNEKNIHSYRGE